MQSKATKQKIRLKVSEGDSDVGYVYLRGHPNVVIRGISCGVIHKTISLYELIGKYKGPPIYLDFDKKRRINRH